MKNKFLISFLCSVFLLNASVLPSYALNDEYVQGVISEGSGGLSLAFNDKERSLAVGGTYILGSIIASLSISVAYSSLKHLTSQLWDNYLSSSYRGELDELSEEASVSGSVEVRKELVREIMEGLKSYTSENEGCIIYDSVINGVPVKKLDKVDTGIRYSKTMKDYSLGGVVQLDSDSFLTLGRNGKKIGVFYNDVLLNVQDSKVFNKEKGYSFEYYDNRLNSSQSEDLEAFFICYTVNGQEGYAVCYEDGDGYRIFGRVLLNLQSNTSILGKVESGLVNEGVLEDEGKVSVVVPSVDKLVVNGVVQSPPMTDVSTGTIVNTPSESLTPGGSGGSGGVVSGSISFAPFIALGDGLKELFPFCLPFDLYNIISELDASPETPSFNVDFSFVPGVRKGEAVLSFDLSPLDGLMKMVRSCELICFCIGLILITRKVIS